MPLFYSKLVRLEDAVQPKPQRGESTHAVRRQVVGAEGLEPSFPKEADFKSAAYANFATPPYVRAALRRHS